MAMMMCDDGFSNFNRELDLEKWLSKKCGTRPIGLFVDACEHVYLPSLPLF